MNVFDNCFILLMFQTLFLIHRKIIIFLMLKYAYHKSDKNLTSY